MRSLKMIVMAAATLCALGAMATTAFGALPDVSLTLGGAYPLHINYPDNGVTPAQLESVSANLTITSAGLSVLLLTTELSNLGTYSATFLNTTAGGGNACSSESDAAGVILTTTAAGVQGTFDVVLVRPGTGLGILFQQPTILVTCGGVKIAIVGQALASLQSAGTEATELTQLGLILKGNGPGKPEVNKYVNNVGETVRATLLANFGAGFLESAENVKEEITATALEGKMFVITDR